MQFIELVFMYDVIDLRLHLYDIIYHCLYLTFISNFLKITTRNLFQLLGQIWSKRKSKTKPYHLRRSGISEDSQQHRQRNPGLAYH